MIRYNPTKTLAKISKGKFRGYPLATVDYFGPDYKKATKIVVSVAKAEGEAMSEIERWYSENEDVRYCDKINNNILNSFRTLEIKSVVVSDRITGCPHDEGIDYPEGEPCPKCPFWDNLDSWIGEIPSAPRGKVNRRGSRA